MNAIEAALRSLIDEALAPLRQRLEELERKLDDAPRKLVSPKVAAERMGVSLPTLRRYLRDGLVKSTRVRRRILVDLSSVPDARAITARSRAGLPLSDTMWLKEPLTPEEKRRAAEAKDEDCTEW